MPSPEPTAPSRVLVSWSTGKDSALLLHRLRQRADVEVVGLLTTVGEDGRAAIHKVRPELLQAQAEATGLPLVTVPLPDSCPNAVYEERLRAAFEQARADGADAIAFGDLFLADVRQYREDRLAGAGLDLWFPLWGESTAGLADELIALGLKARLTAVNHKLCPAELVGRVFDASLLSDLPISADPCGERGEFHTFAFEGPIFDMPVIHRLGVIYRDGDLERADLLPV